MLEYLEPVKPDFVHYTNLIVFEVAASRIPPSDVLLTGNKIQELFDRAYYQILDQPQNLKTQILKNRFERLKMMLDMVKSYDDIVMTKFLNKVWKRYTFFSNLGEVFLDLDDFVGFLPEYKKNNEGLYVARSLVGDDDGPEEEEDDDSQEEEAVEEDA